MMPVLIFIITKTPVDTASLSQVRQPMYQSAVQHWTHFRPYLQESIDIFTQAGIEVTPANPQTETLT